MPLTASQYIAEAERNLDLAEQSNSTATNAPKASAYAEIAEGYIHLYEATKDQAPV